MQFQIVCAVWLVLRIHFMRRVCFPDQHSEKKHIERIQAQQQQMSKSIEGDFHGVVYSELMTFQLKVNSIFIENLPFDFIPTNGRINHLHFIILSLSNMYAWNKMLKRNRFIFNYQLCYECLIWK